MERLLRKPRTLFETTAHPSHLTFDDGRNLKRNFPWLHYVEARWSYGEPDTIQVFIGEWLVLLHGHNLAPLFASLEEQTLLRVRVQSDAEDRERELDSYVTKIAFVKAIEFSPKRPSPQSELDLIKGS
jgi:hypothetical protein